MLRLLQHGVITKSQTTCQILPTQTFSKALAKKTEVLTRISTAAPERGSADTVRDFRGFAVKFKTAQGNNDWVFNNQVSIDNFFPIYLQLFQRDWKAHI
jgi:catalase